MERALAVHEVAEPDDVGRRCELLLLLGRALNDAGESRRVLHVVAPEAFALADARRDDVRAAAACRLALDALFIEGSSPALGSPDALPWAVRLDRCARPNSSDRVWADTFLGGSTFSSDHWQGGLPLIRRAVERARRLGDPEALWWAVFAWLWYDETPGAFDAQLAVAREFSRPQP